MPNNMLLLFIDSLPYELIAKNNLFSWLSFKGPLRPGVGYSFTQKAEILKGQQPDQLGYLNFWYLDAEPTAKLNIVYNLTTFVRDIFPFGDKVLHYLLARVWKKVANIPFEFIGRFNNGVPSSYAPDNPSILSKGKWEIVIGDDLDSPNPDSAAVALMQTKIESASEDRSFFIALPQLDKLGHLYGPDHENYLEHARYLDSQLQKLTEQFLQKYPDGVVCSFSDHGMLMVTESIHLSGKLFNIPGGRRAAYWLDSTMLRVWVETEEEKRIIHERLKTEKHLHILSEAERKEYGVTLKKFGDIMAITLPGIVFSPNHFGIRKPVGMHGFHPMHQAHQAFWGMVQSNRTPQIENGKLIKTIDFYRELLAQKGLNSI